MQLAFILYKYFPFGGLQRDFMRIALECQQRGHQIRVYTLIWEGDIPDGFDVRIGPVKAFSNHQRNEKFHRWLHDDMQQQPVDRVIGFNKMAGLDFYYAADGCYEEKAQTLRNPLYRYSNRYRYFSAYERAVFARDSKTQILMISEVQQPFFIKHYQTQPERFHLLPPGIAKDRRAPLNADEIRAEFRAEFNLSDDQYLLLQVGIGQDNPKAFIVQAAALGVSKQVTIFKGRSDIPRFLLGADLLMHPAYNENTGTVLLEALVSGLPIVVTDVCGYAHYIKEADCGQVLTSPFQQQQLNQALSDILADAPLRARWSENALEYAKTADLYSMPQRAADIILAESA